MAPRHAGLHDPEDAIEGFVEGQHTRPALELRREESGHFDAHEGFVQIGHTRASLFLKK